MSDHLLNVLERFSLFEEFSEDEIKSLMAICHPIDAKLGETVFDEGSLGEDLYLIRSGAVHVEFLKYDDSGYENVCTLRENEVFGELALIDGGARSARITAQEDCNFLMIRREDLYHLMDEQPRLGYRIMRNLAKMLSRRLRFTNMALKDKLSD